jgi:hypothetical protein
MNQTLAIFVDAYRELNSKMLFWVTLLLMGLFIGLFAMVGVNDKGMTFLWLQIPIRTGIGAATYYRSLFTYVGIDFWLSWAATVLALISTAFIFPDFLTGGSIDLFLCKPIGRLRLFFTKYVAGLLFVSVQVLAFSACSFLVLGLRGGIWEPSVFLAIPIVVCFFSYLFALSVLFGVWTRSTIAAVLLTFLFWLLIWATHFAETKLLQAKIYFEQESAKVEPRINTFEKLIAAEEANSTATAPAESSRLVYLKRRRDVLLEQKAGIDDFLPKLRVGYDIVYFIKTLGPKTADTVNLLDRWLLPVDPVAEARDRRRRPADPDDPTVQDDVKESAATYETELRDRPLWWVVGTSLLFEAVVLALAAWIFCRRDY